MWDIVWVSSQEHRSVSISRYFLLQAQQCLCIVRKRFTRDHCCRGRSKPGCRIVGLHTRWELTTWADFQLCLHRLLMSTGCKSSHSGFLDVSRSNGGLRISGWICPTVMFDDFLHQLVSGSLPLYRLTVLKTKQWRYVLSTWDEVVRSTRRAVLTVDVTDTISSTHNIHTIFNNKIQLRVGGWVVLSIQ